MNTLLLEQVGNWLIVYVNELVDVVWLGLMRWRCVNDV